MYIYSYNTESAGAIELAKALNARRIRHENSTFRGSPNKTVINWGSSETPPEVAKCNVLNAPVNVQAYSNKLTFFQMVQKFEDTPRIVPWTGDVQVALTWLMEGSIVVERRVLNGHSAAGLHIIDPKEPDYMSRLGKARLWTKYVPKKDEFRIHFVNKKIIDVQRKALRPDHQNPAETNWRVRNLGNGFIFVRNNLTVPDDVYVQCQKFISQCKLDFGAIDVIYNEKNKNAFILEVNTAPGLIGTTVTNYANAFNSIGN